MINKKIRDNIEKSVEILRKYHRTAIERENVNAKIDLEIVMITMQDLHRLLFLKNQDSELNSG